MLFALMSGDSSSSHAATSSSKVSGSGSKGDISSGDQQVIRCLMGNKLHNMPSGRDTWSDFESTLAGLSKTNIARIMKETGMENSVIRKAEARKGQTSRDDLAEKVVHHVRAKVLEAKA